MSRNTRSSSGSSSHTSKGQAWGSGRCNSSGPLLIRVCGPQTRSRSSHPLQLLPSSCPGHPENQMPPTPLPFLSLLPAGQSHLCVPLLPWGPWLLSLLLGQQILSFPPDGPRSLDGSLWHPACFLFYLTPQITQVSSVACLPPWGAGLQWLLPLYKFSGS